MRLARPIAWVVLYALLVSCQRVNSEVTRFSTLTASDVGKTFVIAPGDQAKKDSLEFRTYGERVKQKLTAFGYQPAADNQFPDYVVFLNYAISGGQTITTESPVYGQTGGGTTYHYGTVTGGYGGYATYSGTSYTPPTYGVVGTASTTSTYYQRFLVVDIVKAKELTEDKVNKVYEGRVVSIGSKGQFAAVANCLIDALFKEFPGPSGKTEDVTIFAKDCVQ